MLRRVVLLALLAVPAAAAPASAAVTTYGPDLDALRVDANYSESHGQDWAAWPLQAAAGAYVAPVQGEIRSVQVKGIVSMSRDATRTNPAFGLRFIVLRPQANGTYTTTQTSPEWRDYPFGGDPQRKSTFVLRAVDDYPTCVLKGDIVALTANGGYDASLYPNGRPVRMFSASSSYGVSKGPFNTPNPAPGLSPGSLQNGSNFRHTAEQGHELLMRTTIASGADSGPTCRGATPTPPSNPTTPTNPGSPSSPTTPAATSKAKLRKPKKAIKLNAVVRLRVSCPGPTKCVGTLRLRGPVRASKAFVVKKGTSKLVAVKLSKKGIAKLKRKRKLTVKAILVSPDGSKQSFKVKLRKA